MRTIVEYSDTKRPRNQYPRRIVSPTHPSPCCWARMKVIGKQHRDRGKFVYKRCSQCGYTVRSVVGLDWRWIRTRLSKAPRPVASLRSRPLSETWIAYRWV